MALLAGAEKNIEVQNSSGVTGLSSTMVGGSAFPLISGAYQSGQPVMACSLS
jgi:hypothetical protein